MSKQSPLDRFLMSKALKLTESGSIQLNWLGTIHSTGDGFRFEPSEFLQEASKLWGMKTVQNSRTKYF